MGINMMAGIAGSFIGLIVGGVLADIDWRLVFWVNVPFGVFGTVWAYLKLRELGDQPGRPDRLVRATSPSASGLVMILIGLTYGLQPYGGHTMGWTSPWVLFELIGGVGAAGRLRVHRAAGDRPDVPPRPVPDPGVHRRATWPASCRRSGAAGCSSCSSSGCRGSGCPCTATASMRTPLWAGIYMLPMTAGFLVAGPVVGFLSDRYGAAAVRHRRHVGGLGLVRAADAAAGPTSRSRPSPSCCS